MDDKISTEFDIKKYKCALSSGNNEHICMYEPPPIRLKCNHQVCNDCLEVNEVDQFIKCNLCEIGENSKIVNIKQEWVSNYQQLFNENIIKIIEFLIGVVEKCDDRYNNAKVSMEEKIDSHIQYAKDQVGVKTESLKMELDKLHDEIIAKLENIKEKWNNDMKNNFDAMISRLDHLDTSALLTKLNSLRTDISKQNLTFQTALEGIQKDLRELNNSLYNWEYYGPTIAFNISGFNVQEDFIAEVSYFERRHFEIDKVIKNNIKKNNFHIIDLQDGNICPFDLCRLPNGNLLAVNYDGWNLGSFDNNLVFQYLNNTCGQFICATVGEHGEIYLSDHDNHKLVKIDMKSEKHKAEFGNGKGNDLNKLSWPSGLCYYNGYLYVCDCQNERIQVFDTELTYVKTYPLQYKPWYIKNIFNVACVRSRSDKCVRFYNLEDFTLIKEYSGHNGTIGTSKLCFYEFYRPKETFYCYDRYGGKVFEEKKANTIQFRNKFEEKYDWSSICEFNGMLVMSIRKENKLIVYGENPCRY